MSAVRPGEKGSVNRIDGLLSPLLKDLGIEEAIRLERLKREWTSIFREPLSLHIYPCRLQNGELLINVDSSVWLHQISYYRAEILANLSPSGVKDIRFRIGKVATDKAHSPQSQQPKKSLLGSAALRQIDETVSTLSDSPVKESIRKAMEKALSKKSSRP